MITANRENWERYLTNVRGHLPQDFENDCADEGITDHTGTYIFVSFMDGTSSKNCADNLVSKLGVDDGQL